MIPPSYFLVAYGLAALSTFVAGSPVVPRYFQEKLFSRANISATSVAAELGSQISVGSLIFGPDDPRWAAATERYDTLSRPDVQVVVEPANESDIAKIVTYCNDNNFEFLVRSRGHGITTSLNAFSGIEINVVQLTDMTIQPDGETALLQAGAYAGDIVPKLWDAGYVTTTGSSSCVGVLGPALGGGYGRYSGLYGLVQDGIVHYNVVLGNGTEIGVNETSHPDLLWALKGAGHNFAVVTSVVKKIYPREIDTWHYHRYIWTQDKLETVFEELNKFHKSYNGTTPPKMGVNFGSMLMNTSISATEAVLDWGFYYAGSAEEAEDLLAPFNAIAAVAEEVFDASYPEVSDIVSSVCPPGAYALSSALLLEYNVTTERTLYDHFVAKVAENPELGATAYAWHEGYSTAGYQAVPSDSTAFPHREENHVMYFAMFVPEGSGLLEAAETWVGEVRDIWNGGQPGRQPKTYVNYAAGHDYETLESIYGYEPWRLDRLRSLKATYDPENRFRFYSPIVSQSVY